MSARFLNMLNHNFVYNDAFDSVYEMTACSEVALLDRAENGYISSGVISGYLYNMYGVEGVDFAAVTLNNRPQTSRIYPAVLHRFYDTSSFLNAYGSSRRQKPPK